MVYTTFNSTQEMIDKLQQLKGKTKLKNFKNINRYYDEMNIRRQSDNFQLKENPFS